MIDNLDSLLVLSKLPGEERNPVGNEDGISGENVGARFIMPFRLPNNLEPQARTQSVWLLGSRNTDPAPSLAEQFIQDDRKAFARLLESGVIDVLAQGQELDFNTNEEITRLIPILCTYFSQEELARLLGEQVTSAMFELRRTELLQNLFLEHTLRDILHAFHEADIALILFKGPALAYQYYPRPHLRTYHDVDALIQPADLARAHELLTQKGFVFYEEFRSNATDATRTGYNYTLKKPDSWLELLIELHTAPHPSEIGTRFEVQDLWKRAVEVTLLDERVLTLHPVDHLLYICWHYRFHGFTRLLWLYDMVVLLRATRQEMDWDALVRRAREQNLATTVYYCLAWCRDLFSADIPAFVFQQLRPPLVSKLIVERFAIADAPRVLASPPGQARRIIARRAMVDSSGDLLKAGLKALFPSRATLGRRYMEHSRLPLQLSFLYYLIHPVVTLLRGLRLVFRKRKP